MLPHTPSPRKGPWGPRRYIMHGALTSWARAGWRCFGVMCAPRHMHTREVPPDYPGAAQRRAGLSCALMTRFTHRPSPCSSCVPQYPSSGLWRTPRQSLRRVLAKKTDERAPATGSSVRPKYPGHAWGSIFHSAPTGPSVREDRAALPYPRLHGWSRRPKRPLTQMLRSHENRLGLHWRDGGPWGCDLVRSTLGAPQGHEQSLLDGARQYLQILGVIQKPW